MKILKEMAITAIPFTITKLKLDLVKLLTCNQNVMY